MFLCFREDYLEKAKSLPFQLPWYNVDMPNTCPGTNFLQFSDKEVAWVNINHEVRVLRWTENTYLQRNLWIIFPST